MVEKIRAEQLHKRFGDQHVLRGVSFSAGLGDVVAVMGSSGSGKSTLLRCINLLTIPDSGVLHIDNQALTFTARQRHPLSAKQIAQLRRKIGMVFQQFNLWPHLTVLQNLIEAPVQVLKQPRSSAIEQAQILLEKVGLADKQRQYPGQLSGGQQQRAAIARALMMKPEIMLFDEPTSALDPEMVNEVLNVMRALAAEGMTMLVATHELGFARNVATHAMFLEHGVLLEQGTAREMFSNPKTRRFQQFLEAVQH